MEYYKIYDVGEVATIENYPYGYSKRCILKATIEETNKGQRTKVQTIFNGVENKPKHSTYSAGRFFATKEGRLYLGWIIKEEVSLKPYRGKGEEETFKLSEVKSLLPEKILKAVEQENTIKEVINKVWSDATEQHKALFEGKTHDDIREHIKNIDNWFLGSGGYYFKNGFARDYYKNVMVSLSCGMISKSFDVPDSKGLRLTAKNKEICIERAKEKLKEWLEIVNIGIEDRENNYPRISHGCTTHI